MIFQAILLILATRNVLGNGDENSTENNILRLGPSVFRDWCSSSTAGLTTGFSIGTVTVSSVPFACTRWLDTPGSDLTARYTPADDEGVDEGAIKNKKPHFKGTGIFDGRRWLAYIHVGNNNESIRVEINTGSSDFWVFPNDKGWTLQGYNITNSTSNYENGKKTFKSSDQDGSVSGRVIQDVCWLDTWPKDAKPSQIISNKCTFGLVNKAKHASATNVTDMMEKIEEERTVDPAEQTYIYVDGMLGLGMAKLDDQAPTAFLPWLARTQNITLFTLNLGPYVGPSTTKENALGFGEIDHSQHNGSIVYTAAKRIKYRNYGHAWGISMTSFEILESQQVPTTTQVDVLIDSGTTQIKLPKELVKEYYTQVENAAYTRGQWQIPCGAMLPTIRFGLEGGYLGNMTYEDLQPWTMVDPPDPFESQEEDRMCFGRLQEVEKGGHAIFGLPIFSSHFLVFDLKEERVGFGAPVDDANAYH